MTVVPGFFRALWWLRWLAVAGQATAVLLVHQHLDLDLPYPWLVAGVLGLALCNVAIWPLLPTREASPNLALAHLLFDIVQLSFMLTLGGGMMNPFSSLLLVPIAIAALSLPIVQVLATAGAAIAGYGAASMFGGAHVHGLTIDLHLIGMAVSFALAALILVVTVSFLVTSRSRQERALKALDERCARAKVVVTVAALSAGLAHNLNTPLQALWLLLDDLKLDVADRPAVIEATERALGLLGHCRALVQQLVVDARKLGSQPEPLHQSVARLLERWQALRPEVRLDRQVAVPEHAPAVSPVVGSVLYALLDNAADASLVGADPVVELQLSVDDGWLEALIRDRGGFAQHPPLRPPLQSDKAHGLGLGLALSASAIDAFGGELRFVQGARGTEARFRLPIDQVALA